MNININIQNSKNRFKKIKLKITSCGISKAPKFPKQYHLYSKNQKPLKLKKR